MSLYHIYRPDKFSEIIGNDTVIKTIRNNIEGEDPPKAIILHGPRGCGKTTIARIISGALGCSIKGSDFVELDAVQTGGIDTAREIRQNMHYLPFDNNSKCRVWVIDEAQDSSPKFQAGLLKALESGPKHCYFILCTTDLSKIIPTVKSRCTQWQVKLLEDKQIESLIKWVLKSEKIDIEQDIINEIINISGGCPREALVILDTIIDLPSKEMMDAIQQVESKKEIIELCRVMLKQESWKKIASILKGLKSSEPEAIRRVVIGYMSSVMLGGGASANQAALIFDCFRETTYNFGMPGIVFSAFNTLE